MRQAKPHLHVVEDEVKYLTLCGFIGIVTGWYSYQKSLLPETLVPL